jgi:hypothetical protein
MVNEHVVINPMSFRVWSSLILKLEKIMHVSSLIPHILFGLINVHVHPTLIVAVYCRIYYNFLAPSNFSIAL